LDAPAPHGPGSSGHASNHPEEIILDKSFTDIKKIHCTYEQLEKGTTLKDLLKDFFGKDSEFDLNFKVVGNLNCNGSDDPSGCTKANYNYESKKVEILVDKDYINSDQTPTIFIALTLIHEAIHANLFLAVKKFNGGVVPKSSDFAVLYKQYRTKKNWQHEYMADKYVDVIAGAIKKVHPLLGDATFINDRNTNFPDWNWDKFYKNLAWGGLDKTTKGEEYYQSHTKELSIYYDGAKADSTKKTKCEA